MSERFMIDTSDGMLNVHGIDIISRQNDIEWTDFDEEKKQYTGKMFYCLVASKAGEKIHRWKFDSEQERESALISLRKEFQSLKIQFK